MHLNCQDNKFYKRFSELQQIPYRKSIVTLNSDTYEDTCEVVDYQSDMVSNNVIVSGSTPSEIGGYANAIIGIVGTIVNITTFMVLVSSKKLRSQTTTIIILAITALNILYNSIILPLQAVMYFHKE